MLSLLGRDIELCSKGCFNTMGRKQTKSVIDHKQERSDPLRMRKGTNGAEAA